MIIINKIINNLNNIIILKNFLIIYKKTKLIIKMIKIIKMIMIKDKIIQKGTVKNLFKLKIKEK